MGSWLPSRRLALVVLLVVQLLSCVSLFVITWVAAHQARLFTVFWSLLKFMSIESVMVSNHLILCCPLLLLPSNFPSIFSNESVLHITWPKYWSFSLNISPSNEYSGLNSFEIYWFDLLAVQGTLKSLLQQWTYSNIVIFLLKHVSRNKHNILCIYGEMQTWVKIIFSSLLYIGYHIY